MSKKNKLPLLLTCLVATSPAALHAVDWDFDDTLTVQLVYTDNVSLDNREDDDFVLEVRPGISANRQGRRIQFEGNYDLSFVQRIDGSNSDIFHNLTADATAELYEDVFFVDANARAGLTSIGGGSTLGVDAINDDDNATQAFSFSVSPYTRHRLGRYADIETRLRLDTLQFESDSASDSDSGTFSVDIVSGAEFANLPWSINASTNKVSFDSNDDERSQISGTIQIPAHRRFTYTATVGYENNDVETSRGDTDGITWNVGGIWNPNPRTNGEVQYGERYFGDYWNASLSHRTKKTRLTASYSQEVTNVRNQIINLRDAFLFNPLTGQIIPIQIPTAELISEDFLNKSLSLGLSVAGLRTTMTVRTGWSNRTFEVTGREEDSYDASVSLSRRLGPQTSGNFSVSWESLENQTTPNADRTTYRYTAGLSRTLGRESSVSIDVSHRDIDDDAGDNTTENRVSASFTTSFL